MDFGALLNLAKRKNDAATKDEGKFYSTKYAPPKKESKDSKQLSSNIQKFLKKREAEEQERKREEREKLANLLAMRDERSKNKIRKMLKVTKSANKSVLDDLGTALDAADQPEGDDYGYVSTEANAFYQKYIEKVKDIKEDKGFAASRPQTVRDLSGTKERVKAAITRECEEAKSHTRQRSSTATTPSTSSAKNGNVARAYSTSKTLYDPEAERREDERKKREEEQKKAKIKRPLQPPPMDFQALLRLAEKKQHEAPALIAVIDKKKEPERLLSAREKREEEERRRQKEERARRERERMRELEQKSKEPRKENASSSGTSGTRMEPNGRIPKLNGASLNSLKAGVTKPAAAANEPKVKPTAPGSTNKASSAKASSTSKAMPSGSSSSLSRPQASSAGAGAKAVKESQSKNPYATVSKSNTVTREFPPRDTLAPAKTRAFPPTDVRGRNAVAASSRKPTEPAKKRRIYDDEEYDSELDDFIDDGDCEEDISSHIRDIFGYDKRRYRDQDDDDRLMESSFAQMQREEFISKKLGLQEDLEDMRMEMEHKKRKMAKKRSRRIDDDDDDDC